MEIIEDAAGVRGREVIPRVIPVASPIAGADWSITVPGGVMWHVMSIGTLFTPSAVVANRSPTLRLKDADGLALAGVGVANVIAASGTTRIFWEKGVGSFNAIGIMSSPLPTAFQFALAGWTISTTTSAIDATDAWSQIVVNVMEIIETPYDVELARDNAALRGITSNAYPQIRLGE